MRDWLYVDDHCEALWLITEKGAAGETYNIGGECEKRNRDVVNTICELLEELYPSQGKYPHPEANTACSPVQGFDHLRPTVPATTDGTQSTAKRYAKISAEAKIRLCRRPARHDIVIYRGRELGEQCEPAKIRRGSQIIRAGFESFCHSVKCTREEYENFRHRHRLRWTGDRHLPG